MRNRVNGYVDRVRDELRKSFTQEYSTREVAGSFALGVFITMLPTLGVGLAVFVALAYLFERINKIALFASVLVLNPVVKWGVYAASISLGFFLLGPVEGFDGGAVTLDDGRNVLIRLWVGNLILAAIAAAIAYPVAYRMVTSYRTREMDMFETVVEGIESLQDVAKSYDVDSADPTSETKHDGSETETGGTETDGTDMGGTETDDTDMGGTETVDTEMDGTETDDTDSETHPNDHTARQSTDHNSDN